MITLTEEQFKEMIEAAHRAGQHNQGHCDPSAYEAMVYYEREVKKLIIPDVSKSLDLRELERKLDEALGKETRETLTEWLKHQRQ